jgi:hypothetical protein
MAQQWFFAVNNERRGPISEAELRQMVHGGVLSGATLVWREGLAEWQPAAACPELCAAPPTSSAAAPLPPPLEVQPVDEPLPTFCKVMLIIDVVLCGLGAVMFPINLIIGIPQLMKPEWADWVLPSIIGHLAFLGVVGCGLAGDILMLKGRPRGVAWGYAALAMVGLSLVIALGTIFLLPLPVTGVPPQQAELIKVITVIGQVVGLLLRVVLAGLYLGALVQFSRWAKRRTAA